MICIILLYHTLPGPALASARISTENEFLLVVMSIVKQSEHECNDNVAL